MKFLKFILMLAVRTVEVVLGLLLLLFLLSWLVALPGRIRFHRYCSYGSVQEMRAAESDDIQQIVSFQQDGSNFTAVVARSCHLFAWGPAVLIYDHEGKFIDGALDSGDGAYVSGRGVYGWRWNPRWNFPSNYSSTEVKLRKMRMPEIFPAAPATMGELAAFLQQATIDYGDPELPKEKRVVKFVCSDAAAKKVFPERPKPTEPLIESLSGADVSIWDTLQKCCRDTGCVVEVGGDGVVMIQVGPPLQNDENRES